MEADDRHTTVKVLNSGLTVLVNNVSVAESFKITIRSGEEPEVLPLAPGEAEETTSAFIISAGDVSETPPTEGESGSDGGAGTGEGEASETQSTDESDGDGGTGGTETETQETGTENSVEDSTSQLADSAPSMPFMPTVPSASPPTFPISPTSLTATVTGIIVGNNSPYATLPINATNLGISFLALGLGDFASYSFELNLMNGAISNAETSGQTYGFVATDWNLTGGSGNWSTGVSGFSGTGNFNITPLSVADARLYPQGSIPTAIGDPVFASLYLVDNANHYIDFQLPGGTRVQ
jgi:hypothetical protein